MSLYSSFKISGADAESFLQGQLSNDITQLGDNPVPSVYCSSQGKILGFVFIAKLADYFVLLTNDPEPEQFIRRLKMFILRAKVTIEPLEPLVVCLGDCQKSLSGFNFNGLHYQLCDATKQNIDLVQFQFNETLSLVPQICAQNRDEIIAPLYNFDLSGGISYTKGCFVGQEPIARLYHRSKPAKRTIVYTTTTTQPLDISVGEQLKLEAEEGKAVRCQVLRVATLLQEEGQYHSAVQLLVNTKQLHYQQLKSNSSEPILFQQQKPPYPISTE